VPDWLEQADYNEQIQVLKESRQGISRSPVHPVYGAESRSRPVKRDTESIRVQQRQASGRKVKAVLITLLVLGVLGGGAWAGWEFYVKPNMPSSSPEVTAAPAPGLSTPLPPATGAETTLPTVVPEPRRTASRAARLGPEERRLVDSNVLGFFGSGSTTGLIVRIEFRKPVNLSGIRDGQIVDARDETGRPIATLGGATAEIKTSDDPTGAMSLRLFVPGAEAARASDSLRSLSLQLGPATIRARYDKALLSR
jgi:hypothetical protein